MFFGNPGYFDSLDQASLGPQLSFQTHQDGFSSRANQRMDPAYQLDETFAWFLPGKKGDHDLKFGTNFVYTPLHIFDVSNLNGTFTFSSTDLDFNAANPRTYPDRLSIRVPGASDFVVNGTFLGLFAQDKWKVNNRVTASIGLRYDLEVLPLKEKDNPKFSSEDAYPVDKNNVSPRIGLTVGARRRRHVGRARRLGTLLSEDAVHLRHRRGFGRRVLGLVHGQLCGPRRRRSARRQPRSIPARPPAGCRPARSWSTARSSTGPC